jgi:aminoglycoside 6'-N-acetyltransferase
VGLRVRGLLTELRPANDDDVDRLVAWHADPEVARFWDWEVFTSDEMRERLARPDVDAWIVEAEGKPIGYLQVHPAGAAAGAPVFPRSAPVFPPRVGGCAADACSAALDMFLAPDARGRGLGPDAARAMTEHLLSQGRTRVTVDPYEWNGPAIRAWERAGFVEVSRGHPPDEDHTAEWVLMEFRG